MRPRLTTVILLLVLCAAALSSCEKKEQPIQLPPAGAALPGKVTMGENYENQVFFDFETNSVVQTSEIASWDLAFQAGKNQDRVFLNGGKNVLVYNTHNTGFSDVTALPTNFKTEWWQYDASCGLPDSTAIGKWEDGITSRREIYIVKLDDTTFKKLRIVYMNEQRYAIEYGNLMDENPHQLEFSKDDRYNFVYFHFKNGVVRPEPAKESWDVVFTRYKYIYHDLNNFQYLVNGVLLNPYNTTAAADSTQSFSSIDLAAAIDLPQTNARDIIGFYWKTYNFTTGHYDVNKNNSYVLRNQKGHIYKLHFLDFYSNTGVKGSPSFESERLQ